MAGRSDRAVSEAAEIPLRHAMQKVLTAKTFRERFFGLMGKRDLTGCFVLFQDCRSIHTCFMKGPIDVAFLDRKGTVVTQHDSVGPWRLVWGGAGSYAALEVPAGYLRSRGIKPGDVIACQPD